MRLASPIWKLLHAAAALAALRVSESLSVRSGLLPGLLAGAAAGLLVATLVSATRNDLFAEPAALTLGKYLKLAIRYAGRADFAGAAVALSVWFLTSPGKVFSPFKPAWLIAGLAMARFLAQPVSRGKSTR